MALKRAKVLMIGAGGLGCPALQYLAAAGVGHIGIVDGDRVDESNLQRQLLFNASDIGKPKAQVAAEKLRLLNPHIKVVAHPFFIDKDNALQLIPDYDLVIDGSDNFSCRYLVNDACVLAGKPLVFGSIFKFEGQVSVFNYLNGPTYRCLFPEPPRPETVPNCSQVGVIGVVAGVVGLLMANQAIKIICGLGEVLSGKLFTIHLLTNETGLFAFKKDPAHAAVKALKDDYEAAFCDTSGADEISPEELKARIEAHDVYLLDVREPHEYGYYHLPGSCSVPLSQLPLQLHTLPKDRFMAVICQKGSRSLSAVKILKDSGFNEVSSLKGGISAWAKEIDS